MLDGDKLRDFVERYWRHLLLTLLVPLGIAAAYVYGGGIELVDNPEFLAIDSYAFTVAFLVGLILPISWYLRTEDVSETVALTLGLAWSLFSGVVDVMVYLLMGRLPPQELPWLLDATPGLLPRLLGMSTVTRNMLFIWLLLSGIVVLYGMVLLYRQE